MTNDLQSRRNFLELTGLTALGLCPLAACGGGSAGASAGLPAVPTPSPSLQTPAPITVAFAGSSSASEYLNTYQGPSSNSRVVVSRDGLSFSLLEKGAFGKVAGSKLSSVKNRNVRFIDGGVVGSTLMQWSSQGSPYRAACAAMIRKAQGVDAILLQVGRNDAATYQVGTVEDQVTKWTSLIAALRSEALLSDTMIFIGGVQDIPDGDSTQIAMLGRQRQAEKIVETTVKNVRYGFSTYDLPTRDGIHQTEASQLVSGGRFYAQLLAYLTGTVQARGPSLLFAKKVGPTQTDINFDLYQAESIIVPGFVRGFNVTENGNARRVISTERFAPNIVRLTHEEIISSNGYVSFGSNGVFGGNDLLVNSDGLPAEPTGYAIPIF